MQEQLFQVAHMPRTGFFALNNLPANTAVGYLEDRETSNIYNLPDSGRWRWRLVYHGRRLALLLATSFLPSPSLTRIDVFSLQTHIVLMTNRVMAGLYKQLDDSLFALVGGDAGVGFDSRYLVKHKITASIFSNITNGEEELRQVVRDFFDSGFIS
ncbi:MAG: hypothetical protein IPK53_07755 [bacterium]|nr:hypothetical protein [bacterium]